MLYCNIKKLFKVTPKTTFSSPDVAIREYFNRPEIKSKYTEFRVLNTNVAYLKMLQLVQIKVKDIKTNEYLTAIVKTIRTDNDGLRSKQKWVIDSIKYSAYLDS